MIARGLAAIGLLALLLGACAPGAVTLGGGNIGGRQWAAIGTPGSEGPCLELRMADADPERICNVEIGDLALWQVDMGGAFFVVGGTHDGAIANAVVTTRDGQHAAAPLIADARLGPGRWFAIAVGGVPDSLSLQDAKGAELRSQSLR